MKPETKRALGVVIAFAITIGVVAKVYEYLDDQEKKAKHAIVERAAPEQPARAAAPGSPIESRRALARDHTKGDIIARTTGLLDTVLDVTSKAQGCDLQNLTRIADKSGRAMADLGFTTLKCIDSDVHIDLGDKPTAPIDAGVPVDAPPLLETTAVKLFADYHDNEIAGDAKYRGKEMRITGRIGRVAKDFISEAPYVALSAGAYGFNEVYAYFADPSGLVERKRGQELKLHCIGDGMALVVPRLKGCVMEAWR